MGTNSRFFFLFFCRLQLIYRLANGGHSYKVDIYLRNWSIRTELNRRAYFYNLENQSAEQGSTAASVAAAAVGTGNAESNIFVHSNAYTLVSGESTDHLEGSEMTPSTAEAASQTVAASVAFNPTKDHTNNNSNHILFRPYCSAEFKQQYCNKSKVHSIKSVVSMDAAVAPLDVSSILPNANDNDNKHPNMATIDLENCSSDDDKNAQTLAKLTEHAVHTKTPPSATDATGKSSTQTAIATISTPADKQKLIKLNAIATSLSSSSSPPSSAEAAPAPQSTMSVPGGSSAAGDANISCNQRFSAKRRTLRKLKAKRPKLKTQNTFITRLFATDIIDAI